MGLCSYSSDTHSGSFLIVENSFINEYLPIAPPTCVKVYLYGLYLCNNSSSLENSVSNMCHVLGMEASEIKDAFDYWQAEGLIQVLENELTHELDVRYLPVSRHSGSSKKRANKYSDFNSKIQSVLVSRMITPSEYNEYYTLIESFHMDEQALVAIALYCVSLKGDKVSYPYIVAVAKSFAEQGICSSEAVKEKLDEHAEVSSEMNSVIKALGKSGSATIEDRNLYIKWTHEFGFGLGVIKEVASSIKMGGVAKLDSLLTKYYAQKLTSSKEIKEYNEKRDSYFGLAKDISRTLGLYYQNLDSVVENYIVDWLQKGYDAETLQKIASYLFRRSVRTMEEMNNTIQKLYKLGLVSKEYIDQYIEDLVASDKNIREVLDGVGILRSVNTWDRDYYSTWTKTWGLSHEIIMLAAGVAKDKSQPISYLNKMLSSLYDGKINTIESAKKHFDNFSFKTDAKSSYKGYEERNYDKKDLDTLFDNLDNIEI